MDSVVTSHQSRTRLQLSFVLLALLLYLAAISVWWHHPADLSALYMAGHLFASGQTELVYAAPDGFFGGTPPQWYGEIRTFPEFQEELVLPYVYPPLWSALLAPLAEAVAPQTFFRGGALLLISLLGASVILAWRMARGWAIPLWAWILVSAPILATSVAVQMAVMQLQPHVLVVFLTLLAFERLGAGRSAAAGVALGLAVAMKLSPAPLVLLFLLERNWRATGWFAATVAVCIVTSLAVAGIEMHYAFLESVSDAVAGTMVTGVTFSAEVLLNGFAAQMGLLPPIDMAERSLRIAETPFVIGLIGKAIMVGGAIWMLKVTASLDPEKRRVARFFLLSLLCSLFGPLGWVFYFLPQILLLPALLTLLPRPYGTAVVVSAAVLTSWPFFLGLDQVFAGDFPRAAIGAGALLALFVAVLLGLQAQTARRERNTFRVAAPSRT
ncbi:glycosyltransferase family 87 protein [Pseudoruegeria sp. HB172150]|uniref:glycosyltransferase family 87 protein n=1 Tax=Pseudoruegeria sp. HB172150 TaxID=2721164 RepID=UPI001C12F3BD|nr:glycosyltransferase family 87 protein [Pseudoruegeria sp. HB172150]